MKLKAVLKYQLREYVNSVIVFYIVVILINILFTSVTYVNETSSYTSNSSSFPTIIFLFIMGLNLFKENLGMMIQNGISRKTMFICRIISMIVISIGMTLIDYSILFALKLFDNSERIEIKGLYEDLSYGLGTEPDVLIGIIVTSFIFMASMALGYLISIAYYRMNKAAKIVVSVGVPVSLFILLPALDATMCNGRIFTTIARISKKALGIGSGTPFYLIETLIILFFVFICISWLLVRRALAYSAPAVS